MNAQGTPTKEKIPGGDYSLKTHTTSLFKNTRKSEGLKVEMNTLRGVLEILDPQNKHILLVNDLADLLGIKRRFQTINLSKRFKS